MSEEDILNKAEEYLANYNGIKGDINFKEAIRIAIFTAYISAYKDAIKTLGWQDVNECLPPYDKEVIVLTDHINGKQIPSAKYICYAHRPNPKGWDGKNIITGDITHFDVKTYAGWNIPGVRYWMYYPEILENDKE